MTLLLNCIIMKELKLNIPENKLDFFLELFRQLGLVISEHSYITDSQKGYKSPMLGKRKNK